jgi:poly(U)-specific endoribonuclease
MSVSPSASELADLSLAAGKLWDLDSNRLVYGRDYEIQLQSCRRFNDGDVASNPLFNRVDDSVLAKPTFKSFVSLLDNYSAFTGDAEVVSREEIMENNAFLNVGLSFANLRLCDENSCAHTIQEINSY